MQVLKCFLRCKLSPEFFKLEVIYCLVHWNAGLKFTPSQFRLSSSDSSNCWISVDSFCSKQSRRIPVATFSVKVWIYIHRVLIISDSQNRHRFFQSDLICIENLLKIVSTIINYVWKFFWILLSFSVTAAPRIYWTNRPMLEILHMCGHNEVLWSMSDNALSCVICCHFCNYWITTR